MVQAHAEVSTEKPARYAKQLSSHLGQRCAITEEGENIRITLPAESGSGSCLLSSRDSVLVLEAEAENTDVLHSVNDVIGRHLERFGEREDLAVNWRTESA